MSWAVTFPVSIPPPPTNSQQAIFLLILLYGGMGELDVECVTAPMAPYQKGGSLFLIILVSVFSIQLSSLTPHSPHLLPLVDEVA